MPTMMEKQTLKVKKFLNECPCCGDEPYFNEQLPPEDDRTIYFGTASTDDEEFEGNGIRTSKYTWYSFFPKNLFEQCIRFTNAYFILLILLMLCGTPNTDLFVSPSTPYGTAITLAALMAFTMVVAAVQDCKRCEADRAINGRPTYAHRGGYFDNVDWDNLEVGDLVMITKGEEIPADVALLASSGEDGEAYVSTVNLDGEPNLKIKRAPRDISSRFSQGGAATPDAVAKILEGVGGRIVSPGPDDNLSKWNAMMVVNGMPNQVSLDMDNLLLRETKLENTDWVTGLVVYTGADTKIYRNRKDPRYKYSTIDRYINISVGIVLIVQILISIISAIIFAVWESDFADYWYIFPEGSDLEDWVVLPSFIAFFFTYFILYSNLMPIALLASMETVNVIQKLFIENDLEMYDPHMDKHAICRTANLCQEIGQVSYVFTDKTGTLTRNQMELKYVSVGGREFGRMEGTGFQAADECRQAGNQDDFWEALATCHSVIVSHDEQGNNKIEAQSPDEDALVATAKMVGWELTDKRRGKMYLNTPRGPKEYTICANNAFTSDRKRQSVLLQSGGEYVLVAKGADNVMLQRAAGGGDGTQKALESFSRKGLRTLLVARKRVDAGEANRFLEQYRNAKIAVHGRTEQESAAAETIEHGWQIVGCTGVEDKLQDNVEHTIQAFRRAGINLWVLTGDKLETAKQIGLTIGVLAPGMVQHTFATVGDDNVGKVRAALQQNAMDQARRVSTAMLITGDVLPEVIYEDDFLDLARVCSSVIACRLSPKQKSELVKLVRNGVAPKPVTLAVGDGANDVPMIMEAQVGVGIHGKEGSQAVNTSDFAITEFQHLQRLLLIHGRWNYRRVAKLIIYTYWKSVLVTYLLFFYGFYCGFSATAVFTGLLWLSYSWWTSAGIVAVACTDQDLTEEQCLKYPGLYDTGRLALDFNPLKVVEMLISSLIHALIIFFVFVAAAPAMESVGKGDFVTWGSAMYVGLLVNVTWRLVHITTTWNWVVALAEFLPIVLFIIFIAIYSAWRWWIPFFDSWWMNYYFVGYQMANQWMFWIVILTLPLLAGTLDTFREFLILQFLPDRRDIIHETMGEEHPDLEHIHALEEENYMLDTPQDMRDKSLPTGSYPNGFKPTVTYFPPNGYRYGARNGYGAPAPYMTGYPQGPSYNMYMMRGLVETESNSEASDYYERSQSDYSDRDDKENYPWDADVWQQTTPSWQCMTSWQHSMCCACCSTGILLIFGLIVLLYSLSVDELVVQYNGDERRPWGVDEESFTFQKCEPSGFNTTTCCVSLIADKDLTEPVHVNYVLDPYYQNYIFYQMSNLWREQYGDATYPFWEADDLREAYCKPEQSREVKTTDAQGQETTLKLYPCGLHTMSFFNDSYWFPGKDFDTDDIFWPSDEDVVKNPDFYPDDPDYLFVNERFPTTISTDEGVDNPHYLVWIRLSALSYVYNRYATITDKISEGENLTVCINASYPLEERKYIYFTEVTGLGGNNTVLGIVLLVCAALAALATLFMGCVLILCPRHTGKRRFKGGSRDALFRKAHGADGHDKDEFRLCEADSSDSDGLSRGSYED